MQIKWLIFILSIPLIFLAACSSDSQAANDVNAADKESDEHVREIAWDFVKEKGWDDEGKEEWQRAKVTKTVAADNDHTFLGQAYKDNYEGKEVLFVSFESTPSILIDPQTSKVIGYKPLETPPVEGYIVNKDKARIWVIPEINKEELIGKSEEEVFALVMSEKYHGEGYMVDAKDIDKELVSSLQVGQKVIVHFDTSGLSAPMYAHATNIKIIEK
ncbi:YobA family protein [Bacillus thermotolerans]|uniref:YobA family protein n=1 Tax=Bacillus thermotolerans TaxID=1221996 RepID=UPI0005835DB9|nr:YobA family protein [Bacillus thermotolerans]KKB34766.1 hypothetical protein QY97_02179 [Bacillus thermotolerans]